jgi:hypothetical protein
MQAAERPIVAYLDLENVVFGIGPRGTIDIPALTAELASVGVTGMVAVSTASRWLDHSAELLRASGWHVYLAPEKAKGNADAALAFLAGAFTGIRQPAEIVLLTSDGPLVTDLVWAIRIVTPETPIDVWYLSRQIPNNWLPTDNPGVTRCRCIDHLVHWRSAQPPAPTQPDGITQ